MHNLLGEIITKVFQEIIIVYFLNNIDRCKDNSIKHKLKTKIAKCKKKKTKEKRFLNINRDGRKIKEIETTIKQCEIL